jgi:putative FmdB family regulatory protein
VLYELHVKLCRFLFEKNCSVDNRGYRNYYLHPVRSYGVILREQPQKYHLPLQDSGALPGVIGAKGKMPIYEYECTSCCNVFEVFQRMTEDPLTTCPDCSGSVKKLMSTSSFQLKGGGWYADGYCSTSCNSSASTATDAATKKTPEKSAGNSADSSTSVKSKESCPATT